jgi:hypothetical protein
VRIILFDDLIVFLCIKNQPLASPNAEQRNTSLSFMEFNDIERKTLSLFTIGDHSSAIPLHLTLIREMPRTNEIMLAIVARAKSDMFR